MNLVSLPLKISYCAVLTLPSMMWESTAPMCWEEVRGMTRALGRSVSLLLISWYVRRKIIEPGQCPWLNFRSRRCLQLTVGNWNQGYVGATVHNTRKCTPSSRALGCWKWNNAPSPWSSWWQPEALGPFGRCVLILECPIISSLCLPLL